MTARRRELEKSYAHPTKRRAGSGKYTPINKKTKTAFRLKQAIIVKMMSERQEALQAAEDAAKERVTDKINEEKEG